MAMEGRGFAASIGRNDASSSELVAPKHMDVLAARGRNPSTVERLANRV